MAIDGCLGAVLTDDDGNPIDFARRRAHLSVLEIQLVGAQIERPITALRRGQARPERIRVTIDATQGLLLAAAVDADTTLAAVHTAQPEEANIARLEAAFEGLIGRLRLLLDA